MSIASKVMAALITDAEPETETEIRNIQLVEIK